MVFQSSDSQHQLCVRGSDGETRLKELEGLDERIEELEEEMVIIELQSDDHGEFLQDGDRLERLGKSADRLAGDVAVRVEEFPVGQDDLEKLYSPLDLPENLSQLGKVRLESAFLHFLHLGLAWNFKDCRLPLPRGSFELFGDRRQFPVLF